MLLIEIKKKLFSPEVEREKSDEGTRNVCVGIIK